MKSYMNRHYAKSAIHGHGVVSELDRLHEHGDVTWVGLNVLEFYGALIVALIGIALLLS